MLAEDDEGYGPRSMRTPDDLVRLFRELGLKITPQRRALFAVLDGNEAHPSADTLFQEVSARLPGISRRTVYQIVTELAELGEIQVLDLGTGSVRVDPNVVDHHHLVCDGCGAVRDVQLDLAGLPASGDTLDAFVVERPQVIFRGRCASCAGLGDGAPRPAAAGSRPH